MTHSEANAAYGDRIIKLRDGYIDTSKTGDLEDTVSEADKREGESVITDLSSPSALFEKSFVYSDRDRHACSRDRG